MPGRANCGFFHRSDVLRLGARATRCQSALIGQGPDELFGGYKRH